MRFGAFLLGGLVGAAAVIYLSDKKNRTMMMNMMASPTDSLGKMLSNTTGKATGAFMNMMGMGGGMGKTNSGWNQTASTSGTAGTSANNAAGTSANNAAGTAGAQANAASGGTASAAGTAGMSADAASGNDGLAQVAKMVNQDPELRRTVNDILTDGGKSGAQLQ